MRTAVINISVILIILFMMGGCCFLSERSVFISELKRLTIGTMPFEKQKWNAPDKQIEWNYRPKMARHLIKENLLVGKTRSEILEMFGENNNRERERNEQIKYELEQIFSFNIDPVAIEYLIITFDNKDKAEKAEIQFYKTGE